MSAYITATGNLGRDPAYREFQNGKVAKVQFGCTGYDPRSKGNTTKWFVAEFWGRDADFIMQHCAKGTKVLVSGEYVQSSYEKDGKTVEASFIKGASIEVLKKSQQQEQMQQNNDVGFDNASADEIPF